MKTDSVSRRRFQQRFLRQIDGARGIARLFDFLPDTHLFVKNEHSQFIRANAHNLALLGVREEIEVIGKSDLDFFSPQVGQRYIDEDRVVMATRVPLANRVWLVPNSSGVVRWYLCTKVPLFDRDDRAIGVAGTLQDYRHAGAVLEPYESLSDVVRHIDTHYCRPIRAAELAKLAHLSTSQFNRKFKSTFFVSPSKYVNRVRLDRACEALIRTDASVTQIASDVGFCDHSYFTKRFVEQFGLTPTQYRDQFFASGRSTR